MVRKQNEIVAAFQAAGATTRDRATTAAALGIHEGIAFRILCRHEILRKVDSERLYLDEPRWEAHQTKRRRLAVIIPVIFVLVSVAAFFWLVRR
jgi:hypothetical protein